MLDFEQLAEYAGGELRETVAEYQWSPVDKTNGKSYNVNIRIKVYRDTPEQFYAIPSHQVKTPNQATPYSSTYPKDTIENAVKDCIRGFKQYMSTVEETEWPENTYFEH